MPNVPGQGILFPERAEELQQGYADYRMFVTFWRPLIDELATIHDEVAGQGRGRIVAIPGPQGAGKTAFASELQRNFDASKVAHREGVPLEVAADNVWHRLAGGPQLRAEGIAEATRRTGLVTYDRAPEHETWLEEAVALPGVPDHRRIAVLDNAEQAYFRQGLVELDDAEFLRLGDDAIEMAARRLVPRLRTDLAGTLLLLLSFDEEFLSAFADAVEDVHEGMAHLIELPHPESAAKEQVVRVNTNRLNRVSYWYCLDRAGPGEKKAVLESLTTATSFTASFAAVDRAIRSEGTRTGRPPLNNVITLVAFVGAADGNLDWTGFDGEPERTELEHGWATIRAYTTGWASGNLSPREQSLLESEWSLRVAVFGDPFVAGLLAAHPETSDPEALRSCKRLLRLLSVIHGPGTHDATREDHRAELEQTVDSWPSYEDASTQPFWEAQQARSARYEAALGAILDNYDRTAEGFLHYRPDHVVKPFKPCSILDAPGSSRQQINAAIRRDAHVLEFTAQRNATGATLAHYLASKLPNYVAITQEQ